MPTRDSATATNSGEEFDARPAVTLKLGKKRTDELIIADGDTWDEYLAVCEKADTRASTTTSGGGALSFFGKKKKKNGNSSKKDSTSSSSNATTNNNNLTIRSYFQNRRTGKKVWDEPPSGASKIVPASEEMRRMAAIQLDELYVATATIGADNTNIGGIGNGGTGIDDIHSYDVYGVNNNDGSNNTMNSNQTNKKKSFVNGLFRRSGADKKKGQTNVDGDGGDSANSSRRIRYKPDSNLAMNGDAVRNNNSSRRSSSNSNISSNNRNNLNDRQLQEAIARSISDSHTSSHNHSGDDGNNMSYNNETEDDTLRRVLEESRLDAISKPTATTTDHRNERRR
jgi:hypothetical protein